VNSQLDLALWDSEEPEDFAGRWSFTRSQSFTQKALHFGDFTTP